MDMVQCGHGTNDKKEDATVTQTDTVYESDVDVIQCMCGTTYEEEGTEYVQCERCLLWQHSKCAQFNNSRHSSFVCLKCLLDEVCVYSIHVHVNECDFKMYMYYLFL